VPTSLSNGRDYYLKRAQLGLIFLSFFALTVPLSVLQLSTSVPPIVKRSVMVSYLFLLGNTHFAITWALYLNSANLAHFRSSLAAKFVYFVVPVSIMAGFFVTGVLEVPAEGTLAATWFFVAITAVDYFHSVRQSFGVLQMVKGRSQKARFSRRFARVDNAYFLSLWMLQIVTFVGGVSKNFDGRFEWSRMPVKILTIVAAVLFIVALRGFVTAWRSAGAERGALFTAVAYFLLQTASACLVVYRSRLYFASLAMHYVEYHVLMVPRCFDAPLDPKTKVDRIAAWFRGHKTALYGAVVAVAAVVSSGPLLALGGVEITRHDRFGWLFVNLLGGIFVAHYFVEAFVWRFRHPFWHETLAPLYFARSAGNGVDAARGAR
jgi:hypothetical protein